MANKEPETDDIIKYLGYEIHPGKIGEFWKSDEEKKQYLQQVKAQGGQSVLDRETAILNARTMSLADKAISFFGSILLVIGLFFPIYSFEVDGRSVSGSALSYFANIGSVVGYASDSGFMMLVAFLLLTLILLACPVLGVLNIIGLINKKTGEEYLDIVKQKSRFLLIPLGLYLLLFLVLIIGGPSPVKSLGETINLGAIFTMTGLGFWLNISGLALVFAERRGI
jgi:hypothetical protein